jgi:hypothetical protein
MGGCSTPMLVDDRTDHPFPLSIIATAAAKTGNIIPRMGLRWR